MNRIREKKAFQMNGRRAEHKKKIIFPNEICIQTGKRFIFLFKFFPAISLEYGWILMKWVGIVRCTDNGNQVSKLWQKAKCSCNEKLAKYRKLNQKIFVSDFLYKDGEDLPANKLIEFKGKSISLCIHIKETNFDCKLVSCGLFCWDPLVNWWNMMVC